MKTLGRIVHVILVLIIGVPLSVSLLYLPFLWLDGNLEDWISETGKYAEQRIERIYTVNLRAARTAYNVKRYDIAISYFESAINLQNAIEMLDTFDEADWLKAARTAYNVKRYNLATSCFENVISLHNTDEIQEVLDESDFYQFIDCLEKTGKIEKSIQYAQ